MYEKTGISEVSFGQHQSPSRAVSIGEKCYICKKTSLQMTTIQTPRRLSNVQAVLLSLFETDLAEEDLHEIRNLLTRFMFKKAQQEADKLINEDKISLKSLEKASDEIIEHRGTYLKKIRNESRN